MLKIQNYQKCKKNLFVKSQIQGARLHGAQVLPGLLGHLQGWSGFAASDHVPPDVNLKH